MKKSFQFAKYHGAGNDFIMIDNRDLFFPADQVQLIERMCHRRFGIGADGLILLQNDDTYDFNMRYFNADGREASMCGNGGRCIVAFAKALGIISNKTTFNAVDGLHDASIDEHEQVRLGMSNVDSYTTYDDGFFLDTGSPHFVQFTNDLDNLDVEVDGRRLRFDERFQPSGLNVNFVKQNGNHLTVYTFERGVEGETLACGTGVTAAAIAASVLDNRSIASYDITAKGGKLKVELEKVDDKFTNIWLTGPAEQSFEGIWS